ncbi:MAG: ABC transporter permease [Acidobacteria bacterium]|nr:ABC transporter permease [Acidobacteriota bacterium]
MSAWGLAWRTVVSNPARAVLAITGVAVIGALLFNMLLLSRGMLVSFRDLLDAAGFDIRVVSSQGSQMHRPPFAGATTLADAIRRLPGIQQVAIIRTDSAMASIAGRERDAVSVAFVGTTASAVGSAWDLLEGTSLTDAPSPGDRPSIIVNANLAEAFHLAPGSTLRLRVSVPGSASALPPVTYRVAGIGTSRFESADEYAVTTTIQGFDAVHGGAGRDEAEMVLVASRPGVSSAENAAAIAQLRPGMRVMSTDQVMQQFNDHAFTYFRQISTVLSALTLAFAFLLVATLLTISTNQRLGEVAALRALGFSRRRIAANLLCESALLVGIGGLAALPIGGLLAIWLDRILRHMPGVPERIHFFVFEPRTVALHAALMAGTGILAAIYPIWLAARLPIAATLRNEIVS